MRKVITAIGLAVVLSTPVAASTWVDGGEVIGLGTNGLTVYRGIPYAASTIAPPHPTSQT